ncbi:mevalonate kinase [Nocardia brasiliensis]|uniref:mevalonate kinase n=1 Tax=Nocardia brasiliensis TaxID=37326 RepID=UPI003D8EDDA0
MRDEAFNERCDTRTLKLHLHTRPAADDFVAGSTILMAVRILLLRRRIDEDAMSFTTAVPGSAVGTGSAHGKAILIGEHTVVYGVDAISVPLPTLIVEAVARRSTSPGLPDAPVPWAAEEIITYFVCGPDAPVPPPACGAQIAVATALQRWGRPRETIEVWLRGTVPSARGLGASAAYAAAAVRAAADAAGETLPEATLFELVQCGERWTHGRASGIDAATVMATSPVYFHAGAARPLVANLDAVLVLADSGVPGSTRRAVRLAETVLHHDSDRAHALLDAARLIVASARTALASADAPRLGARMTEFHAVLTACGVSTPELNRLADEARAAGALGAKLTGGGLGGCVLALTAPNDAQVVAERLLLAGAIRTWAIPLQNQPR